MLNLRAVKSRKIRFVIAGFTLVYRSVVYKNCGVNCSA